MSETRQKRARPKAGTVAREVLGGSRPTRRIRPKWRQHFRRLANLHDHLLQQQRRQFADAVEERPTFSMHMADAGTDAYDRDMALGMLSHEQDAVYEIEEALNRIRNGTYGICELTGERIPAARLNAIPWTRFTAAAERTLERKGRGLRAKLGPRETARPSASPRESGQSR